MGRKAHPELPVYDFPEGTQAPMTAADDALNVNDAALSALEDDSPSPINVSWSTTTGSSGSVSPTVRAAIVRARTAGAAQANGAAGSATSSTTATTEHATGGQHDTLVSTLLEVGTGATVPTAETGRSAASSLVLELGHGMTNGVDNDDDYFRFFATPPVENENTNRDDAPVAAGQSALNPPRAANDGGNVAGADDAANHGELVREFARQNDVPNTRKRLRAGTPDTEGQRRSSRRPRPAGTTPRLRSNARLPSNAFVASNIAINVANPWAEELRAGVVETGGAVVANFVPVSSSTPVLSSVPGLPSNLTQPRQNQQMPYAPQVPSYATPIGMPNPRAPVNNGGPHAQNVDVSRHSVGVRGAQHAEHRSGMDVDAAPTRHDSPTPARPRNGKGKARATTEDLDCPEQNTTHERMATDGWDEREDLQARQESLRQALHDRAGRYAQHGTQQGTQTDGAGPSHPAGRGEWGGDVFYEPPEHRGYGDIDAGFRQSPADSGRFRQSPADERLKIFQLTNMGASPAVITPPR